MISLPQVMLGEDLPALVGIATAILDDYECTVECNAEQLITAEPVALCLLAASFWQLERRGQHALIQGLRPEVRQNLEQLDVLADWFREQRERAPDLSRDDSHSPLRACRVATLSQAEQVANALSHEIAAFVPGDDFHALIQEDPTLVRYRAVEQPLYYVIAELLDNALNHGKVGGFIHARAWIAAQYYRRGDLLRVAIVDDGCGFLRSLASHSKLATRSHESAVSLAFRPFVSSHKDVGVFDDSVHQGLGLTVCRDLCLLAEGHISAASGTAWVTSPTTPLEAVKPLTPGHQGVIVMMDLHRRAITSESLAEILRRYRPDENLPARLI
ncbi:MAG: ATP-binding protein [Proteobacteria bacterium]|nr:ATP-binding protein [Pseudomonadota bacterium]